MFEIEADTAFLAMGMRINRELIDRMRHCAPETSAIVGDVRESAAILPPQPAPSRRRCISKPTGFLLLAVPVSG